MSDQEEEKREPVSVYEHVARMLEAMAVISWQKLGLQPDMITGKVVANFAEAKVAIDTTAFLASQLESELDDEDRRRIHGMVRDLRINYVQKMKEAGQ
jgi:hypothetical protein